MTLLRSFQDEATGWFVEERRSPNLGEPIVATLRDPESGTEYRRTYDPDEPTQLLPIAEWVSLIRLGATIPARPDEAHIRRAQRVLSMVHELHKLGYQRVRVAPHLAPSGLAWRCVILPRSHVAVRHGAMPVGDAQWPTYSSASENEYFGWPDAKGDSARMLARRFMERFPHVIFAGKGHDWEYVGWYTHMLGLAERGDLPVAFGDMSGPVYDHVPTTAEAVLPMPPPGEAEG